jgi:hypothetical protein
MALSKITADSITANTITSAALANTGVTSGVYGGAAAIPIITVDSVGRLTSAANVAISSTRNTANNLAAGSAGTIPYQTGAGATAMLATGTAGQVLTSNGTNAPTWSSPVSSSLYTSGSLILSGPQGYFGGGSVYVLQNPSTVSGTLKWAGYPAEDIGHYLGMTSNRNVSLSSAYNIKRDFYNNQLIANFQGTVDINNSNGTIKGVARSKDGIDWTTIAGNIASGVGYDAAVNKYTGRNVVVAIAQSGGNIWANGPDTPFNLNSATATITGLTSITSGGATSAYYINFIDNGSQGSSYFLIYAIDGSTSYVLYSQDGNTWSNSWSVPSRYYYTGQFVGNATEVILGHNGPSTAGIASSTDGGLSYSTYNFGDSTHGTSSTHYPIALTHNGTYWLSVGAIAGSHYLVTKTMGSGTTWTFVSGFPTTYGTPTSVAYNSVDSKWYVLAGLSNSRVYLYSSSQANPNTSSWTLVQSPLQDFNTADTRVNKIMALSSSTFNPTLYGPQ